MPAREVSVATRVGRILLMMSAIAAAMVVAVATGAIPLPGPHQASGSDQASAQASLAAERTAADKQWASVTCTNILDWKNEIKRDGTRLDLGFGLVSRIQDAIAATTRMLNQLDKLGLPPGGQSAQARAEIGQLRSDIASRLRAIEGAAGSVASGNVAAIGALLSDLENDESVGPQLAGGLRHVVSIDLGLSLVETRACRQLVGIPI